MNPRLIAVLICATLEAFAVEAQLKDGALCIGGQDTVSASDCISTAPLPDAPFLRRTAGVVSAARLQGGIPPETESMREVVFTIAGDPKRWPALTEIEIADPGTKWRWSVARTQVRGRLMIRLLPGNYQLTISASGHQRLERPLEVSGDPARIDLGSITLRAARMLTATVVAEKGRPVTGCAAVAGGVSLGFSDARGRLAVDIPAPPPEFVVLSHPEFAPRIVPIIEGTDHALGTVRLVRGATVVFTIDRTKIAPEVDISAKVVQLVPSRKFRELKSVSLARGESEIRFQGLEPGEYVLDLEGGRPGQEMVLSFTATEGVLTEIPVVIDPLRLHFTVLHGDQPIGRATVRLHNSGNLERRIWTPEIRLDDQGEATVDLWQRGRIWAHVISERIGSTVFPAEPRDFSSDDTAADWDIVVPRHRVQGTVVDAATGDPIEGARVIHDSDVATGRGRITDKEGRFAFEALDDGVHRFRAESARHTPSETVSVTFPSPADARNIEFRLRRSNTIPVEVRDAADRPIESAIVLDQCFAGPWNGRSFRTDAQGVVALPTTGGRHTLCVIPLQGSFAIAEVDASRPAGLPPVQIRVPPPGATIKVVAATATGLPVAQLGLLLTYNGRVVPPAVLATLAEIQRRPGRTDPRGELLLAAMPAGQYEFRPYTMPEEAATIAADPRVVPPVYAGYLGPGEAVLELVIERKR